MATDTRALRYFVQIAECGSLSKASEQLYIAQPALSRQLLNLEEYVGFRLFTRTGRGMILTKEGEYLKDAIAGPLRNIELAVENLRAFKGRSEDFSLGIGIHKDLGPTLSHELVMALEDVLPDMRFRILEGSTSIIHEALKLGTLDYAIVDETPQTESLSITPLLSERLVLVGTNTTAKGTRSLTVDDLKNYPVILPCSYQSSRKTINNVLSQAKINLNIVLETDSTTLILGTVKRHKGLALLNQSMALSLCQSDSELTCVDIDPGLTMDFQLVSRWLGESPNGTGALIEKTIKGAIKQMLSSKAEGQT